VPLEAPRDDGGVVDRPVEGEVELHVPLEPIERRAVAAKTQVRREGVRDLVRDDVPVAGRRLGLRPVGPEPPLLA
jgi:hypothetical protein